MADMTRIYDWLVREQRINPATGEIWKTSDFTIPTLTAKQSKIAELSRACNLAILAGFTSDALGSPHNYDFDDEAQRNLAGRLGIINANPDYPAVFKWKTTDSGPLDHTKAQFTQLCTDADTFKDGLVARYWTLKSTVNGFADTDTASINGVTW